MQMVQKVTLVVGKRIAGKVVKQDAAELVKSIENSRKNNSFTIPPVRITDEVATSADYEIMVEDNVVLTRNVPDNMSEADLITMMTADVEGICKYYL